MIDMQEFCEWRAFYALEPFGPNVEDLRAGMLMSRLDCAFPAKGQKTTSPSDYMLTCEYDAGLQREQTQEEMSEADRQMEARMRASMPGRFQ